ncbi:MAG: glycosyltransferase family 2 protein [Acidobacteriota bacterium]
MTPGTPLVSVIIATYNRSNVLCFSIASVLRSRFTDWELLVVGDACTDDTEAVVASFGDPRIRFFNIEKNFGDQGGPNNEGFRHARGRYVAYLSHDDFWLPDHLDSVLGGIEETQADIVHTLGLAVKGSARTVIPPAITSGRFVPNAGIPSSLWLARREVLEQVGPWRHPRDCYLAPSQDLLLRAWRAGKCVCAIPRITVVIISAGDRPNVYATREVDENRRWHDRMLNELDFMASELHAVVADHLRREGDMSVWTHFRKGGINILKRAALAFGVTPMELSYYLRYRGKGRYIDRWRRKIGLRGLR